MTPRRLMLGRFLARHRRGLGTFCAVLALAGAVLIVRPPPEPTVDVLVASRDLTAVSPVRTGDTAVRSLPGHAVPRGALRPGADPAGESLTGPVLRGEVLTTARLADPPAEAYGAELVASPVRITDPGAVALLGPGSRVDILAAGGGPFAGDASEPAAGPATAVVTDRPVIAVPESDFGTHDSGALILVAVRPEEARALAGHAAAGQLSVSITG
ncbi:Flp pilus assembly protein CpaB [Lipingzhangella halophila]|uniref:Flp pilus assembly protein CpaB n=1 Tax=Lipingzhangella halophila TaxID=1783352 RepID=A0A7W7RDK6_9ACTN|nr:Flp pilus assembly protein CpaB [Lipingzhangella halophila]MBB4929678.1 Flp pilus assembly protein CpaB [Lipingzhangella halophila]